MIESGSAGASGVFQQVPSFTVLRPFPRERIGYVSRPVLFIESNHALIRALALTACPLVRMLVIMFVRLI